MNIMKSETMVIPGNRPSLYPNVTDRYPFKRKDVFLGRMGELEKFSLVVGQADTEGQLYQFNGQLISMIGIEIRKSMATTLFPIMDNLIEIAKHDENILKMLYETTDEGEIIFNLVLGEIDAESYKKSAEIELELSERYEDLDITVNPVDEDEIIIDEKYQFYIKG